MQVSGRVCDLGAWLPVQSGAVPPVFSRIRTANVVLSRTEQQTWLGRGVLLRKKEVRKSCPACGSEP